MKALVLEEKGRLTLREIDLPQAVGPHDVKIAVDTVGVCGSDVHYYTHGKIGPFVVNAPMVLGHEAAGEVIAVGAAVTHLAVGDRVCMEPGIPDPNSKASKLGIYNVDPAVQFWATPPVHGCLAPEVVHPAAYTYKLPESVSYAEGAMVEPFAIGMQAALRAKIRPGDSANPGRHTTITTPSNVKAMPKPRRQRMRSRNTSTLLCNSDKLRIVCSRHWRNSSSVSSASGVSWCQAYGATAQ